MNRIQRKILVVCLLTVILTGGVAFLITENVVYRDLQPTYITYNGTGKEVLSEVSLNNSGSSGKRKSYKSGEKDYAAEMNEVSSNNMPDETELAAGGFDNTVSGRYNYNQSRRKKSDDEIVSTSGNQPTGMLALGSKNGKNSGSLTGSAGSDPFSQTGTDTPPSVIQLAPQNKSSNQGGGHPGGDPELPVGEGWWILILLAAGYAYLRRK